MKITQEEVTHVANLSKLKFSPEETAEFATTLSEKLSTWWNCWKKWTQPVLPQQRPWRIVRPYCVRMLLKKGRTVTLCLKMYLKKDNYYIKVPAILEDGGEMPNVIQP